MLLGSVIGIIMAGPFVCRKCAPYNQSNYCLFVAGTCMPISRPRLEVRYVLSWPAKKVHYLATRLLPICCQCNYTNFVSEVGGAICIIMAGPFDCQKCT